MHFNLISAPTVTEYRSHAELGSAAVRQAALLPQLGVLAVAALLERCGDTPVLVDANAEYMRFADAVATSARPDQMDGFAQVLAERAVQSHADVYGLSTICSTFPLTLRVARAIKQMRPGAMVLLGGPQVSVVDAEVMEAFPFIDFVLRGEVEHSLPLFYQRLTSDYSFADVPGLTYRDGGTVRRTSNPPLVEDLDALPQAAYHLSSYLHGMPSASIELGRGCPFACTFCSTNDFFRRRFRLRSPQNVLAEMRSVSERYGVHHFELVHDMFTVDRKRVVAFCEAMAASGDNFTWDCSARTDCVDEDLLQQMAESGCRGVFFGIESGSTRMQRLIDKDLDPARAEEMLHAASRHGLRSTCSLITGFPEERWEDLRDTLRVFITSARCEGSFPQLNLLAPLARTPLHLQHKHELTLDELCSDMSHQGLSQGEDELELIRAYPDIFPNFYMMPIRHMDRDTLFELREFVSMAVEQFRRLLCVLAYRADLLSLHAEWRGWREAKTGPLSGGALRRFYAEPAFVPYFLEFLEAHPLRQDALVSGTLAAEAALQRATLANSVGEPVESGASFDEGIFLRHPATEVLRLACDLQMDRGGSTGDGPFFYATRREADGSVRLHAIQPLLARLLQAAEGVSVDDLTEELAAATEAANALPPVFWRQFVSRACSDGWLVFAGQTESSAVRSEPVPQSLQVC